MVAVAFHEHYEPARGMQQCPNPADVAAGAEFLQATRRSRSAERLSLASLAEIDEVAAMSTDNCLSAMRRCIMEVEVINHSGVALQARPHASASCRLAASSTDKRFWCRRGWGAAHRRRSARPHGRLSSPAQGPGRHGGLVRACAVH